MAPQAEPAADRPVADEQHLRLLLVAGRRILAREGAGDGPFGLLAVRSPSGGAVLVTPGGAPELLTAADIVAVDIDAPAAGLPDVVAPTTAVALAVLRRRPDVSAVVHTHSRAVSVLSTLREPIGMYNEMSTLFFAEQEVAEDDGDRSADACERLAAALGQRRVLIVPGHGVFAAAPTLAEAVIDGIALEKAAAWDLEARRYGGAPIVPAHVDQTKPLYTRYFRRNMWEANLRRLRRDEPEVFAPLAGR